MAKLKRVFNVSVPNREALINLMEALTRIPADITAESRLYSVRISVYGTKEEIREISKKIAELSSPQVS
ncbi:MAG: hypothetical protein APU95_05845 [Hadesarchaea archaeon YNP_N21]|jgi:hypothetical protein|nr:MAG: hypothetical protein APU95_05845 [Hadesarchaea archaeon YNP_N21]